MCYDYVGSHFFWNPLLGETDMGKGNHSQKNDKKKKKPKQDKKLAAK
jgi:hypothetical protein